ncbi:MAG: hypothetical protein HQL69_02455 [Magnetococcales bacterium]|nr:hypothetical protein [Magnetococcales bacterium]
MQASQLSAPVTTRLPLPLKAKALRQARRSHKSLSAFVADAVATSLASIPKITANGLTPREEREIMADIEATRKAPSLLQEITLKDL